MNDSHDSGTRCFTPIPSDGENPNGNDITSIKQRLTIGIFSVIILILLSFAVLIFGQIFSTISQKRQDADKDKRNQPDEGFIQIPTDAEDVKVGNLVLVSETFNYDYKVNTSESLVNVYDLWIKKSDGTIIVLPDKESIHTYSLGGLANKIQLNSKAFEAFNKMLYDYCESIADESLITDNNKSNVTLAWGYSDEVTLRDDVKGDNSKTFYDNSTGNTLTIQRTSDSSKITESILKSDYKWIYENMYKYGFILRYPNDKEQKTGFNGKTRVHLRYVGYEHAYYMQKNNLCLEEYLELIRTEYKYDSKHLMFDADNGSSYEIYYVASTGNPTNVSVPKDGSYYMSGDNMNGFIITVKK